MKTKGRRPSLPRPPRANAPRRTSDAGEPGAPDRRGSGKPSEGAPVRQSGPSGASQRIALAAAQAGLEKKALGVEIIDVTGKVDYADYLVLMSGQNNRNVDAIAHNVDMALSALGIPPMSIEGMPRAEWVLIDFVDVVVHVFEQGARSLYDLDGLWMDARRVPVPDADRDA